MSDLLSKDKKDITAIADGGDGGQDDRAKDISSQSGIY
jgi:hypothetical protein